MARPRVAVLVDGTSAKSVQAVRRRLPDAQVTRIRVGGSAARLHTRLAAAGPFDVILDRTGRKTERGRLFENAFQHLRTGGCYVAAGHAGALDAVLEHVRRAPDTADPGASHKERDRAALGRAVGSVEAVGNHLVVVNRGAALAKVVEKRADRLLRLRGGPDRVLHQEPGAELVSRCELVCSGERPSRMPALIEAPPLSLREYSGAVCVPGQVLVSGNLLLPDTYRHHQRSRLTNMHTTELGRRFASAKVDLDSAPLLEGTYFYLDNEVRGHFGHAITEQVSLLWALEAARRHTGRLKAVLGARGGRRLHPFELELFAAAGFGADDLVLLEQPTRVERLLAATPSLSMPEYVHPLIARTWAEVGDALARKATLDPEHDRIFVGRRVAKRACRNADEVEALFTERGFTVVYPEDYALPDQVALFRRAEVIAGYAGSGLFQMCFVPEPRTVIQVRADTYTANNEYLMASVLGHRLVSVAGTNDRTEDEERRREKRFQSSFRVDLDQEGRFLRRVLADL